MTFLARSLVASTGGIKLGAYHDRAWRQTIQGGVSSLPPPYGAPFATDPSVIHA